jgi:hypothetical protein
MHELSRDYAGELGVRGIGRRWQHHAHYIG